MLERGLNSKRPTENRKSMACPPTRDGRPRRVRRRPRSKSFCLNEEARPATQISFHTAISRPRASCPATISPACRCTRSSPRADTKEATQRTCNARASSRSRSLGRAASSITRAARIASTRLDCAPNCARPRVGWQPTGYSYATVAGQRTPRRPSVARHVETSIAGVHPIFNILRIDNVETEPAERITANDEERQRQGFDIQTVFAWSKRDGAPDVVRGVARDTDGPFLALDYAPGALISRINKGLRRRKEKSILGFGIDPGSGRWTKGPDEDENGPPDNAAPQRVVPIVQDNKNAALYRFLG